MSSGAYGTTSFPARLVWIPALGILAYGCYYFLTFTLDDPFISFRYAENFAHGHGLVFNPGERVEGYSNLLWVLLMVPCERLGLDSSSARGPLVAAKLLGLLLAFACVPLMLRLARRLEPDRAAPDRHAWLCAVPTLVLGLSVYFPMWAVSGLETPLFAYLMLLAAELYLRGLDGSAGAFAASAFVLWLLGCTRPEGFFVAGAFVVHLLLHARRVSARRRLGWIAACGAGALLLTLFRHAYYGAWLPNTFYAKVGTPRLGMLLRGVQQSVEGLLACVGLPLLGLVPLAWSRRGAPSAWWLAIWIATFGLGFVVAAGGDWMPGYRLLIPFLPWFGLLLEATLRALLGRGSDLRVPARDHGVEATVRRMAIWKQGLVVVAILAVGFVIVRAHIVGLNEMYVLRPLHKGGTFIQPTYVETALWLRAHLPAEDWVAVGEAGVIPYFAGQRCIDLLALNDATLARLPSRFSSSYVLQRAPQYVLLAGLRRGALGLESQYAYGKDLLGDERFAERYRMCRSFGPTPEEFSGRGQNFVLYARQDCSCDGGARSGER